MTNTNRHASPLAREILAEETRAMPDKTPAYIRLHQRAMDAPGAGFESAIVMMFQALQTYASAHRCTFESLIGEDNVLGPVWAAMAKALIGLLNGETGRLDCGTLCREIRKLAQENGVTL